MKFLPLLSYSPQLGSKTKALITRSGIKCSVGFTCIALIAVLLAGCRGRPVASEVKARQEVAIVGNVYRPGDAKPVLPILTTNSPLSNFLAYAVLNHPRVESAYYDWAASVEKITIERSLPDPRLTFQSDIADVLMSIMPGIMMDFPGPGKLKARANLASAESTTKYYAFETSILQTAYEVKRTYYQLYFLEDKIRVAKETKKLLGNIEELARMQNEVGKVTLQDVLRAQIELERMITEITNLEDSRSPMQAQFKATLGMKADQPAPPIPAVFESTPVDLGYDKLFEEALARNPRLKGMESEIRMAEAGMVVARKGKVPDFSLGFEANAYSSPTMFSPQAGITLPIWRDKIAADIAGNQMRMKAAEARLSGEQIALAVDFAEKLYTYREAIRMIELLRDRLIPKARMALETARENYQAGKVDFFGLFDAQKTLLEFQMSEIGARTQKELALIEVSLLILGQPPVSVLPVAGKEN